MKDKTLERLAEQAAADTRRRERTEPFYGLDVEGKPPREELGNHERRSLLSLLPRRSLWPDVDQLTERITELQRRHTEAQERARDLSAQRAVAPSRDAQALSEWELGDRQGPKPEPTTEALDHQLAEAERDRDALAIACDRLLEQKSEFVTRHRDRLVRVAAQQADAAHARARKLIDELAQVRENLTSLRTAELWAALFPAAETSQQPQTAMIAYGLAAPVRDTLGLRPAPAFEAAKVLELLRRDVDELRTAATPEQRARLEGRDERTPAGVTWGNPTRSERVADLERHAEAFRREWGFRPSETQLEAFIRESANR
jgi:hypothetical protein